MEPSVFISISIFFLSPGLMYLMLACVVWGFNKVVFYWKSFIFFALLIVFFNIFSLFMQIAMEIADDKNVDCREYIIFIATIASPLIMLLINSKHIDQNVSESHE